VGAMILYPQPEKRGNAKQKSYPISTLMKVYKHYIFTAGYKQFFLVFTKGAIGS
jgi:hypothetical protein